MINSFGLLSLNFVCTSKCGDPALPKILNVAGADWLEVWSLRSSFAASRVEPPDSEQRA